MITLATQATLTGKYGEDSKLIYDIADQGGEILALRWPHLFSPDNLLFRSKEIFAALYAELPQRLGALLLLSPSVGDRWHPHHAARCAG